MGEIGMVDSTAEDDIKTSVLVDNTAQGIFKYLEQIENQRETYAARWAWELIQNALDSSNETGELDVRLALNGNTLVFEHNGRPFSKEEVAHLIYHGSTKTEQDLGKFGTGFLVTHLLSRTVKVSGIREDRNEFSFLLNRNGHTANEIKRLSEESWKAYKESLIQIVSDTRPAAKFEYMVPEANLETARTGMDHLREFSPFILVFNKKIRSLTVDLNGSKTMFRSEILSTKDDFCYFDVKAESDGGQSKSKEIIVGRDDNIEIAINYQDCNDRRLTIQDHKGIPKLFVGLPLVGTEDFPIPFPVNSYDFDPNENRDGVYLGQSTTQNVIKNKSIIQRSMLLVLTTLAELNSTEVDGFENVLEFPELSGKFKADSEWLKGVQRDFIESIQKIKVIRTAQDELLQFIDSVIPLDDSLGEIEQGNAWKLAHELEPYKQKLPALDILNRWKEIIQSWKRIGISIDEQSILTLKKVAVFISGCGSLREFNKYLLNGMNTFTWLNQFFEVVKDKAENLFDFKILPNQAGNFIERNSAYVDFDIEEPIKDISEALGINLKDELLNKEVSESVRKLLKSKKQSDVIDNLKAVISPFKDSDVRYKEGNRMFFAWILRNKRLNLLDGFPVESESIGVPIKLSTEVEDKPLSPKGLWNEKARGFLGLFQQEHVISSLYLEQVVEKEDWELLESGGYLRLDPLYFDEIKIDDELLAEVSANIEDLAIPFEHEIVDKVQVSKIALWNLKDDKGLMDTVRKSHTQAKRFLGFLFEYAIVADEKWRSPVEVKCLCGNMHRIYPSLWMAKLRGTKWVPTSRNHQDFPTAQNLANVIEDEPDLVKQCRGDLPSRLLDRLGISVSSMIISIAAKDDTTRLRMEGAAGSLLDTFKSNIADLNKIAKLAEEDPGFFVEEISKRFNEHVIVQNNQTRGRLVEDLLVRAFNEKGIQLIRTGVGSDYSLDNDLVENDQEVVFQIQREKKSILYIEVKSTKSNLAKMTLTQAHESVNRGDSFVLAVVPLENDDPSEQSIKESVKFVYGIGKNIIDKLNKVNSISEEQKSVNNGDEGISVEWKGNEVRFVVDEGIWKEGTSFEEFIQKVTINIP